MVFAIQQKNAVVTALDKTRNGGMVWVNNKGIDLERRDQSFLINFFSINF